MEPFARGFAQAVRDLSLLGSLEEKRAPRRTSALRQSSGRAVPLAAWTTVPIARPRAEEVRRRPA